MFCRIEQFRFAQTLNRDYLRIGTRDSYALQALDFTVFMTSFLKSDMMGGTTGMHEYKQASRRVREGRLHGGAGVGGQSKPCLFKPKITQELISNNTRLCHETELSKNDISENYSY